MKRSVSQRQGQYARLGLQIVRNCSRHQHLQQEALQSQRGQRVGRA